MPICPRFNAIGDVRDLLARHGCASGDSDIRSGINLYVNSRSVCKGDVALFLDGGFAEVCEVAFHVEINGEYFTAVSPWKTTAQNDYVRMCIRADSPMLIDSKQLLESCIYHVGANHIAQVILPAQARVAGQYLKYRH